MTVLTAVLLGPTASHAGGPGPRGRFHLLTPQLLERLSPAARNTAQALVRLGAVRARDFDGYDYPKGTGFVVGRQGTTVLILTNQHVAEQISGDVLVRTATFLDGTRVQLGKVVASSAKLDYALVAAEVPSRRALQPLELERRRLVSGDPIFKISAAGDLRELMGSSAPIQKRVAVSRSNQAVFDGFLYHSTPVPTIVTGEVTKTVRTSSVYGGSTSVAAQTSMRVVGGNSGSPIVSKRTGRVTGLLWGAQGDDMADGAGIAFSTVDVLKDLKRQLAGGKIAEEHVAAVRKLANSR